jgi:polysaccharide deacetylase 2 family uncharacterized protein YibQ
MRKLLVLAVLGAAVWFIYTRWWPANNPQLFAGRLESAVNHDLSKEGISDRDILNQVRIEHRFWKFLWIESRKTVRVSNPDKVQSISTDLQHTATRLRCTLRKVSVDSGTEFRIDWYHLPLQKVTITMARSEAPAVKANHAKAAFVIDDVAYETESMDRFASLGIPLTFAILPRERHSGELSRKATAMNFPVMLHLPMEPKDVVHNDPGPSALMLKMTDAELKSQFDRDVASVPNIVGINNHMGSAFTENETRMKLVLGWVKKRHLYFLDSRTSGKSMGCKAARLVGVPCLANQTFLDNADDVKSIKEQLDIVIKLALQKGETIAIGHYRRKYLVQALMEKIPEFKAKGVDIVTLPTFYHQ